MKKNKKILVVGRAGLDLYAHPINTPIENASQFTSQLGGSAANIAAWLAIQGNNVDLMSPISNDSIGDFVINSCKKIGINTLLLEKIMEIEKSLLERIGFGKRLLALIIDTILSSVVGFALSLFADSSLLGLFYDPSQLNDTIATFENFGSGLGNTMQEFFKVFAGIGVIGFLIMIIEGFTGQTPAKIH